MERSKPTRLGPSAPFAAIMLSLAAGCGAPDAGAPDEPTARVVLGDSERGTSDGVGPAARFQGLTAMCALGPQRIAMSDTFGGTIRLLDLETAAVTTLAGRPDEPGVVDGSLDEARFVGPRGLGCMPDGDSLLVADDGALRLVDLDLGLVTTVAGRSGAPGYEDGSAVRARFGYLIHAIAITPDGRTAILSDRSNDAIRAIDLESYEVRTVSGAADGWDGPGGLAFDPSEETPSRVWVADTFAGRIRGLDLASGEIQELGASEAPQGIVIHEGAALSMGFGDAITRTVLSSGTSSAIATPFGGTFASPVVVDGALVYAELARGSVRRLDLGSLENVLVAGPERPRGHVDGAASDARFEQITDLVAARDGSWVIVADAGNRALRRARFAPGAAGTVDTLTVEGLGTPVALALAASGDRLAIADYGTGSVLEVEVDATGGLSMPRVRAGGLDGPYDVAWGEDGALFVAELDGARITRVAPDGTITVHAGTGMRGTTDGAVLEARFRAPAGLASSSGGLLILDTDPGAVRWSDFGEGTVVTLSGGTDVDEPADGALEAATWALPTRAIAVGTGAWLVTDAVPGTLRLVERDGAGGSVRTIAGSILRSGGLPAGAVVPLSRVALGGASAVAEIEGGLLVATDTAVVRIDGDAIAER